MVKQMARYVDEAVPAFHALPAQQIEEDVRDLVHRNLEYVMRMLRERRPPDPSELTGIADIVTQRAGAGIPLEAMLQASQVAIRSGWALLVQDAEPRDLDHVLVATSLFMQLQENVTAAVYAAYTTATRPCGPSRHDARHELINALLAGAPYERYAKRACIQLAERYHVVALRATQKSEPTNPDNAAHQDAWHQLAEQEVASLTGEPPLSSLTSAGGVILLPESSALRPSRAARQHIKALVHRLSTTNPWLVTATMTTSTVDEIPRAHLDAQGLLNLVNSLDRGPGLYELQDVMYEYQITRPGPANDALRALLNPLMDVNPKLLHTLQLFVAHDLDRHATAARLGKHPNTVDYRLKRIADITGYDPAHPPDMQRLSAALIAWRAYTEPTETSPYLDE
ncbi:PucR family transcriptional regulator [Amycolatopsis sp. cmx-11-12]|uniref:PucR family transcriptional regulator n=1 Tax=Amycolatopsis sp. cmx-11-12 TaxID=2785795 RepID=UPI003917F6F2